MFGQMLGPKTGMLFYVGTFNKRIGFAMPSEPLHSHSLKVEKSARIKVTIYEEGQFKMFDGVATARKGSRENFSPGLIGLGMPPWLKISGEVRYSNMRIRKAGPADSKPKAQVAFFLGRLEKEKTYDSYLSLGIAFNNLKKYNKAVEAFAAAEKINPKEVDPILFAGKAMARMKKYDQASKTVERAVGNCVDNHADRRFGVLNYLTWMLATCSDPEVRDGDKAVKYAEEMVALLDENNHYWGNLNTIAAAYAEAGQFENAIKHLQSAIQAAEKADNGKLEDLKKKLKLYQDGKPFHQK